MRRNLFTLALFFFVASPLFAQHEAIEGESHIKHHNAVALFVGSTIISPSGFNLPTIGLEYVREINRGVGIGLITEVEIGSHIIETNEDGAVMSEVKREGAFLVLPAIYLKLYKGLLVSAGYGVEFEKNKNLGLAKISLEYKLPLKNPNWCVLPTISWDHTKIFDGYVYGVNFAYAF